MLFKLVSEEYAKSSVEKINTFLAMIGWYAKCLNIASISYAKREYVTQESSLLNYCRRLPESIIRLEKVSLIKTLAISKHFWYFRKTWSETSLRHQIWYENGVQLVLRAGVMSDRESKNPRPLALHSEFSLTRNAISNTNSFCTLLFDSYIVSETPM